MKNDMIVYSKETLKEIKEANLLNEEQFKELSLLGGELQDTFLKQQVFRTETEMRVSVLNELKYPTNASKYWQSVREQAVMFENLVMAGFDYKKNELKIKKLKREIEKLNISTEDNADLDIEEKTIDLEECLYKRKTIQLTAQNRVREIGLWSKIKKEMDDKSFDTTNVNTHQLVSYTQRYLLEVINTIKSNSNIGNAEATNLFGQCQTMLKECEKRKQLNEVLKIIPLEKQEKIMSYLGYSKNKKING